MVGAGCLSGGRFSRRGVVRVREAEREMVGWQRKEGRVGFLEGE